MATLLRKSWRDLARARWQAAGLALITAVVVILAAGGARAGGMLQASRDAVYERLAFADLDVRFTPTHGGLAEEAAAIEGVAEAEERLLVEGVLEAEGVHALPALVRVLPPSGRPQLNRLHVQRGRLPRAGERGVVVDRSLAAAHGIGPGDEVVLRVEDEARRLPVLGVSLSPEHVLFPVHPEYTLPLRGSVAVVAVSAAAVAGVPQADRVDSLLVRLAPGADRAAVRAALAARLPVSIVEVVAADEHPGHTFTEQIRATFGIYMPSTAAVIVLIALALLVLTLLRHVHRQRRALGTLVTLGHGAGGVATSCLAVALVPVAAGIALGALAHGAFARTLFTGYARSVGYAPLQDPGVGWALPVTAAACLATAACACWLPALALLRASPADLLAPADRLAGADAPGLLVRGAARLRDLLRLPLWLVLGLTHVARRRLATAAGVLGLGAAFAVVTAFLLVHVTQREQLEAGVERLGLDATVHFVEPLGEEALVALAAAADGACEPLVSRRVLLESAGETAFRRVVCAAPGRWLDGLKLTRGRRFARADEALILVDAWIAHEHGVDVGDTLRCYAYRDAPEGRELTVAGVLEGATLGFAVVPLDTGRALLELDGLVTGAHVVSPREPAALEAALRKVDGVEAVYTRRRAAAEVHASFAGSEIVLTFTLLMTVAVAVLFLGVLAALDAHERAADFAVLAALGWRRRAVAGLCLTEVLARGFAALLPALALAPLLAGQLLDRLAEAHHYRMALQTPAWVFLAVAGTVLALLPLGAWPALRAAGRAAPARVLRRLAGE